MISINWKRILAYSLLLICLVQVFSLNSYPTLNNIFPIKTGEDNPVNRVPIGLSSTSNLNNTKNSTKPNIIPSISNLTSNSSNGKSNSINNLQNNGKQYLGDSATVRVDKSYYFYPTGSFVQSAINPTLNQYCSSYGLGYNLEYSDSLYENYQCTFINYPKMDVFFTFNMPSGITAGTINYAFKITGSFSNSVSTGVSSVYSGSLSINSNAICGGLVSILFLVQGDISSGNTVTYIYYISCTGGQVLLNTILNTLHPTPSGTGNQTIQMNLDLLNFVSTPYSDYLRGSLYYDSNDLFETDLTLSTALDYIYRFNITLYVPLGWNLTSTSPIVPYTQSNNNYVFSNVWYTNSVDLIFLSGPTYGSDYIRQPFIVDLQDNTSNYLSCSDFETCWTNDWSIDNSNYFSSANLNHSIVYNGISSLRLQSNGVPIYNQLNLLPNLGSGNYYITFDYYFQQLGSSKAFYLYGKNAVGGLSLLWNIDNIGSDTIALNRWHSAFVYANIVDSTNNYPSLRFMLSSYTNAILFLDNIHIYTVSTTTKTIGTNQLQISSPMSYWTPYGLFSAPSQNCSISLWDRTTQQQLWQTYLLTDANGLLNYVFQGALDQREYMVKIFALQSWWGIYPVDSQGTWSGAITTKSTVCMTGISCYTFENGAYTIWFSMSFTNPVNIINMDYFTYYAKANKTLSFERYYLRTSPSYDSGYDVYQTINTNYNLYVVDLSKFSQATGNNYASINAFMIRVTTQYSKIWMDGFHFIQSQQYFFTPSNPAEQNYAKNMLGKSWDFSNSVGFFNGGYDTSQQVVNGYLNCTVTVANSQYSRCTNDFHPLGIIDLSYYNNLIIRVYSSSAITRIRLSYVFINGSWSYGSYITVIPNAWLILNRTVIGTLDKIYLMFCNSTTGEYSSKGDFIHVDWVKLSHADSNIVAVPEYDFNQVNFLDGFSCAYATCTESNNYFDLLQTATYGRMSQTVLIPLSSISYFDIKAKATSNVNWNFYLDNGVFGYHNSIILPLTINWQEFKIPTASFIQYTPFVLWSFSVHSSDHIQIDWIHFIKTDSPSSVVKKSDSTFQLQTEQQDLDSVWIDNNFLGTFNSIDLIPLNLSAGTHLIRYQLIYPIGFSGQFLPSVIYEYSYSIANSNIETLIFRNMQGQYIDPNTFNVYVDSSRTIDGSFLVQNTFLTFNLTITDAWNYIIYSNNSEVWVRIKDFILPIVSLKVQNTQPDPVWVQIQRGVGGATFSQWVFSSEVISYFLYSPAYYTLTYNFAYIGANSSYNINDTSYVNYSFYLANDIAFRITGTNLTDIFSNIGTVISQISQTDYDLQKVNVSINLLNSQTNISFNSYNSNLTILTRELNILNSNFNGNISLITTTASIVANLSGDFLVQSKFLDIINSTIMGNLTLLTQFLNITSSLIKGGNITLQTQLFNFINSTINGNLTLVAQNTINALAQLKDINSTLLDQLAFQVIVSNFYLSDSYVNLYAVATKNFAFSIYENNSLISSGAGLRAGTLLNYPRNQFSGVTVEVAVLFSNGSSLVWFNTSYSNSAAPNFQFSTVLVSPTGVVLTPYPVLVYVNYSTNTVHGWVNGSTELYDLTQSVSLPNSTSVSVFIKSGFNEDIYNDTFDLTSDYRLTIQLNITTLTISNTASDDRIVELWRHNVLGLNVTISSGESVTLQLLPTSYIIKVFEVFPTPIVNANNQTLTKQLLDFTTLTLKSAGNYLKLSNVSNSGVNVDQVKSWFSQINPSNLMLVLISTVVGALSTVLFGEVAKRIATQRFKEKEQRLRNIHNVNAFRK